MIGILGLQGDVKSHCNILQKMGVESSVVRYPSQLDRVEGLIIPGGESSTMTNLMERMGFYKPLTEFAKSFPVLGTCAGLILMAKQVKDSRVKPLGFLNVSVDRNGFGRQIHSFSETINVIADKREQKIIATFIRAPKISDIADSVEKLAEYNGEPIAVREGKHIGLTFHPELNGESIFHELMIGKNTSRETIPNHQ